MRMFSGGRPMAAPAMRQSEELQRDAVDEESASRAGGDRPRGDALAAQELRRQASAEAIDHLPRRHEDGSGVGAEMLRSGLELVRRLRAVAPALPAILLTGFVDELPALYFVAPKITIAISSRVVNPRPALQIPQLLWSADTLASRPAIR